MLPWSPTSLVFALSADHSGRIRASCDGDAGPATTISDRRRCGEGPHPSGANAQLDNYFDKSVRRSRPLLGRRRLPALPFGRLVPRYSLCNPSADMFLSSLSRPAGCITGAGRIWPEKGFWNRGEMSGFVSKCSPSLRCLGGQSSQCAVGYEADYCAQCSTGYGLRANRLGSREY